MNKMKRNITLADWKQAIKNGMKAVTLDFETSLMDVRTFYIGHKVQISCKQIKKEKKIITAQLKWYGKKPYAYVWYKYKGNITPTGPHFSDTQLLQLTGQDLAKADIIIGQNLDRFDMKVMRERLVKLGLPPLDNKPTIDILKLSRQSFALASHQLDHRSKEYGFGGKKRMQFEDWDDIQDGKVSPYKKMVPYGLKDVIDTEAIFNKEFDHYLTIPAKIVKIVNKFLDPVIKAVCLKCARAKQGSKYNVTVKGQKATCNVCGNSWKI
jgi:hypothetical protein